VATPIASAGLSVPARTAPCAPTALSLTAGVRVPLILLVDDDRITLRTLQQTLSRAGFETVTAGSLAEANQVLAQRPPDLILLDVMLPDGDGFDLCRRLQADPVASQIPVLFISAHDDIQTKVEAFEAGAVDYITKPPATAEVMARVTTHLRLRQAYDQLSQLLAERVQRLAGAQASVMPQPGELPQARFGVSRRQVLQAGGDMYDVIPVGPGIVDYVVADASGHDLAASYWTAALKTLLTEYAGAADAPRHIMRQINRALERVLPEGVFFTMVYARLNRLDGRLTLVSAGHPPALVRSSLTGAATVVAQDGDVLGAFQDAGFGTTDVAVKPADRLVFFTDGLIEAGGDGRDGLRRLIAAVERRGTEPLDDMLDALVLDVLAGQPAADDIVVLGVDV
jgi:phosphoserine phosphatase RsbU/P